MSVFRGLRYCSKFLGGEICLENRCALTGELCNCFERWYSSSPKSAENSSRSLASSSTVRNPPQLGGYLRTGADVHEGCPKILVTGASGQVGAEFVPFLRDRFGRERVVPSDVRTSESASDSTCVYCDVQDKDGLTRLVLENEITTIVHLASVLSGRQDLEHCSLWLSEPFGSCEGSGYVLRSLVREAQRAWNAFLPLIAPVTMNGC